MFVQTMTTIPSMNAMTVTTTWVNGPSFFPRHKRCDNPWCPHERRETVQPAAPPMFPNIDWDAEAERCLVRRYFRDNANNPLAGPCMISCPCRLCTPYFM